MHDLRFWCIRMCKECDGAVSCVLQVGFWMLYTSAQLLLAVKNGTLAQHPMFCYESIGVSSGATQQTSAPEVMLPANQPRSAPV